MNQVLYSESYQFSSAHFYHQPKWTKKKNKLIFGKCNNPDGHGHDYKLHVYLSLDHSLSDTNLKKIIKKSNKLIQKFIEELDHHHLNYKIPYFKKNIPTSENIAKFIYSHLKKNIGELSFIRLYEKSDLYVEYQG